ncbi:hypothetical protein AAMO2058_000415200 [Amorphochlora amoebiformis]
MSGSDIKSQEKLERYHSLIEEKLKRTLQRLVYAREHLYKERSEYIQLRNNIKAIQESKLEKLKSLVNLGSEFYAQAVAPEPSRIFVDVGLTLHVELTLDEAMEFCRKREKHLKEKADTLSKRAANIRANIKLVYDAMAEIMLEQESFKQPS